MDKINNFNILIKPSGAKCNLACDYCFYLKKEAMYLQSDFRMDEETLEIFIEQYIKAIDVPEITFSWQGGEPTLMGVSFFERVVKLQDKHKKQGQKINNNIQTNGILINDSWGKFLAKHQFLVGLSLDGPAELHDAYRKTTKGTGTQEQVLAGLKILKKHDVDTNILACVSQANVHDPISVYHYFRDEWDMQHMQFIPLVERLNAYSNQSGTKLSNRSITGQQYGEFLVTIFDDWIHNDVGNVFIQIFENCVGVFLDAGASICIFQPTCGLCLALEHNGDLYACDHYVQPDAFLGNIHAIALSDRVNSPGQINFGKNKQILLPDACRQCEVLHLCNGGCPKNRILVEANETYPINHLCQGYKTFFNHIQEQMKLMAGLLRMGRPASDIIHLV